MCVLFQWCTKGKCVYDNKAPKGKGWLSLHLPMQGFKSLYWIDDYKATRIKILRVKMATNFVFIIVPTHVILPMLNHRLSTMVEWTYDAPSAAISLSPVVQVERM